MELSGFVGIDWRVSEELTSHHLQPDYSLFTFITPFRFVSITLGCGVACIPLFGELRILKIGSYAFGLRRCIHQIVQSLKGFETLYFYLLYGVGIISVLLMIIYQGVLTQVCVRDPQSVVKNPEALTSELWASLAFDPSKCSYQFCSSLKFSLTYDSIDCQTASSTSWMGRYFVAVMWVVQPIVQMVLYAYKVLAQIPIMVTPISIHGDGRSSLRFNCSFEISGRMCSTMWHQPQGESIHLWWLMP